MKNISIRLKIMIPMALLVLLLFGTFGASYASMLDMKKGGEQITDVYAKQMSYLSDISLDVETLQRLAYAHCTATDTAMKAEVETLVDSEYEGLVEACRSYEAMLSKNGADRLEYDEFRVKFDAFLGSFNTVITASKSYQYTTAQKLANTTLKVQGAEVNEMAAKMIETNQQNMAKAIEQNEAIYTRAKVFGFAMIALGVIVAALSFVVCILMVTKPLRYTSDTLKEIVDEIVAERGDLTKRIELEGRDEIGLMSAGINEFIEALQRTMKTIVHNTDELDTVVGNVTENVRVADANSHDISAVMEELAASMEEISASSAEVSNSTGTIDNNVGHLADKAAEVAVYAQEMKERAAELEKTAENNKNNTNGVVVNIIALLKKPLKSPRALIRWPVLQTVL